MSGRDFTFRICEQPVHTGTELRIELPENLMLHFMGKFVDKEWYEIKYDEDTKDLMEAVRLLTKLVKLHEEYKPNPKFKYPSYDVDGNERE